MQATSWGSVFRDMSVASFFCTGPSIAVGVLWVARLNNDVYTTDLSCLDASSQCMRINAALLAHMLPSL